MYVELLLYVFTLKLRHNIDKLIKFQVFTICKSEQCTTYNETCSGQIKSFDYIMVPNQMSNFLI